jgi:translation initiation factor IF-3
VTTLNQKLRYESSSSRNVQNLLDRFRGVNKGTLETRAKYLKIFSDWKDFALDKLKVFVGVKASDTSHDTSLSQIVDEVAASIKKSERLEKKAKEEASKMQAASAQVQPSQKSSRPESIPAVIEQALADEANKPLVFVLPKATKPTKKHKK